MNIRNTKMIYHNDVQWLSNSGTRFTEWANVTKYLFTFRYYTSAYNSIYATFPSFPLLKILVKTDEKN